MILSDTMTSEHARVEARDQFEKRLLDLYQKAEIKQGKKPEAEPFQLSPAMMAQMGIRVRPKPKVLAEQESR
jgi:hypothetical protein